MYNPAGAVPFCWIVVPLGYSGVIDVSHADYENLRRVLGDFNTVRFRTSRLAEKTAQVEIWRTDVPGERRDSFDDGLRNVEESVTGMVGDELRLKNGELMQINWLQEDGARLEFIKYRPG